MCCYRPHSLCLMTFSKKLFMLFTKSKERHKDNNPQSISTANQKHDDVLITDGTSAYNQTLVHSNICNTSTPEDLDSLATGKQKQNVLEAVMSAIILRAHVAQNLDKFCHRKAQKINLFSCGKVLKTKECYLMHCSRNT